MPDLDKNYLAGLYLDQITLDVMPQEYIDAALEVKLRRDACAPRAGYNCVQDRRVKGGFYYRKAPQGQGVNALPPSKLERALARSQEQSSAKTEMGFLSKAAIAAGLTVGGLALTGAVVNAGRSSEPFQEPAKPKTTSARTTFNPTSIGVVGAGTIAVGAASLSINKKPVPQNIEIQGESISPVESAQQPAGQNPVPPSKQSPEAAKRKRGQVQASEETPPVTESIETPKEKRNTAPEYVASRVSTLYGGQSTTRNGFEELDTIRSRKALKDYSDEDIDNAIASNPIQKIQVKGKTYIRDLDKVSEGVLINEAVNLRKASSKVNTTDAPEVRRLLEARDRKIANLNKKKDPTPEEKEAVAKLDKAVEEMRTAIGDREKNPVRSERVKPEKKPSAAKEQEEVEKPAIVKPETKADIPPTQKSKKELKEEEAKRLASSIDAIANVNMTAQLRNTKKFSMADQDAFAKKATPEQKAKLSETIGKEIEKLGFDSPEGEELRGFHEALTGKKYAPAKPVEDTSATTEKEATSTKKEASKGTPVTPPLTSSLSLGSVTSQTPEYSGAEIEKISKGIDNAKGSIPALVTQVNPVSYEAKGAISDLIVHAAKLANNELDSVRAYTLPKEKDIADAMLRQQDILYRNPSDIEPSLSQKKIKGQTSITSSLDLDSLTPTKPIDKYDSKTIESLAKEFVKVGDTVKPIITIQKDPLSHEIVDGHLQYYAAKKASEINPQYTTIRSYPAEDMNHAEAIASQYEAVRKAIAETDAVKAAVGKEPARSQTKPEASSPSQPSDLIASAEKAMTEFDKKQKALKKKQGAREAYVKKLDKITAGEWIKDPDSSDRYSSNARKSATDKDASLFISIEKEDDGWMVYTEEHEPEDIADVFSGNKAGKTRFFSLEQAKEAAGEFAEYYEGLVQENKAREPENYTLPPAPPVSEKKSRSPRSKSVNTAASTAKQEKTRSQADQEAVKSLVAETKEKLDKYSSSVAVLRDQLQRLEDGGKVSNAIKESLQLGNIDQAAFKGMTLEEKISKIKNTITYQEGQAKKMQEALKKAEVNNDAIATSESYLQGYYETRNKYRRSS